MNIPQMIRNKKKIDINKVKILEDNVIRLCESKKKSSIINDNSYLISVYDNKDLFHYLKPISELQLFIKEMNLDKLEKGTVLMGKFLLDIFIKDNLFNKNTTVYLFSYTKNTNDYKHNNFLNIIVNNQTYENLIHIVLKQKNWFDKIAYENDKVYISNIFILEYMERNRYIGKIDPLINQKFLIFNFENEESIHQMVKKYNFYGLLNNKNKNYEECCDNMIPIERALLLLSKENNQKLKLELKNIIILLSNYTYLRSPSLYFNFLGIEDEELKSIIYSIPVKINIDKYLNKDCSEINKFIMNYFIETNKDEYLIEFFSTYKYQLDAYDCENIVKYNSRKVLKSLVVNNLINKEDSLCCMLLTESIDMIEYLELDNFYLYEKSKSIIKEIINRNKYVTFYYLYKLNNNILQHKLENENTIIHEISNISKEIIKLILNLNPEMANIANKKKQNILMTNIDKNIDIIIILLQYVNLTECDFEGNSILHYIVNNNRIDIIKYMLNNKNLKDCIILNLNKQNKDEETPIIKSTINNNEAIFYILYNLGSNIELKDIHGNSIYHYICKNKMCIGMELKNDLNKYGFYSQDYANISKDYWKWI